MKTLLLTGLMVLTFNAFSGEKGNGGDGYYSPEGLVLFDLFESGVYRNTAIESISPGRDTTERVSRVLQKSSEAANILGIKIEVIKKKSPAIGELLLDTLTSYKFRFIDHDLVDIKDTCSFLRIDQSKIVQLAVRDQETVYINNVLWEKLDDTNKAALILHELIFSFERDKRCSEKTRVAVSEIFSPTFEKLNFNKFYALFIGMEFANLPENALRKNYFVKYETGSRKTYYSNEINLCGQSQWRKRNWYTSRWDRQKKEQNCQPLRIDQDFDANQFCSEIAHLGVENHISSASAFFSAFELDLSQGESAIKFYPSVSILYNNTNDSFDIYGGYEDSFWETNVFDTYDSCVHAVNTIVKAIKK